MVQSSSDWCSVADLVHDDAKMTADASAGTVPPYGSVVCHGTLPNFFWR